MNDPISFGGIFKILPWLIKGMGAVFGGIIALILGGFIKPDGSFQITQGLVLNLSMSVAISVYGGSALIEYHNWHFASSTTIGFIFLCVAVFGMLVLSVLYQAIALMKGKPLGEVVGEVADAFSAIKNIFLGKK